MRLTRFRRTADRLTATVTSDNTAHILEAIRRRQDAELVAAPTRATRQRRVTAAVERLFTAP